MPRPARSPSRSCRSCTATRSSPADALTHTRMRHGADRRADAGRRRPPRPSSSAPPTTPTTRRSSPTPADLPAVAAAPSPPTSPARDAGTMGRGRPAPAALRRPGRRRARGGVRRARDGRGLDAQRRARGRLPGRDASPRAATSTATSRRSARRSATRSGARSAAPRPSARSGSTTRPTRSPTSTRSSTCTRSAGATTACSRRRPAASRAACSSAGCSSCSGRTARCALTFLVGRRPAHRARHPLRDADEPAVLQRRHRPGRARPVAGRPDGLRLRRRRASRPGTRRVDFLRGDEAYKYEWGAVDEPIQRLLVRRRV